MAATLFVLDGAYPSGVDPAAVAAGVVGSWADDVGAARDRLCGIVCAHSSASQGTGLGQRLSAVLAQIRSGVVTRVVLGPYTYVLAEVDPPTSSVY